MLPSACHSKERNSVYVGIIRHRIPGIATTRRITSYDRALSHWAVADLTVFNFGRSSREKVQHSLVDGGLGYISVRNHLLMGGRRTGGMSVKLGVVATAAAMNPENSEAIMKLVGQHAGNAKDVRNIFTVLTVLFAVYMATIALRKIELKKTVLWGVAVVFMLIWMIGAYKIALAGHMGATLVHKYQVTVPMEAMPEAKP